MAILDFDYNAAISQAKEIETVASEIRTLANRQMQTVVDMTRKTWTGDAASNFLTYCDDLKAQMLKKADTLDTTASTIRNVAARLEEAEQRAKAEMLAMSQSSGGSGRR